MRLEVSRYFVWTSRPSSGDVIKNLIINIRSPKMILVLFRGEPESNPWNDNWNRRWKFTNVVHFTPSKILRRHHCHPYRHHHQQQHHFHFSSSSWPLALEPYLSRWAPFDFFLPVIDIEGALVSMSTVREKVSCTFSYRILRGLCTKWTGPSKHCDIRPGQWGRSCLLRFMGPRRKRNQLIVLKFIQNVSGFKICLPSSI